VDVSAPTANERRREILYEVTGRILPLFHVAVCPAAQCRYMLGAAILRA